MMKKIVILLLSVLDTVCFYGQTAPTREEVGAAHLTDEIAPVVAPFDMPELTRPQFPDRCVSIVQKGARENKLATRAIQKAIDELAAKGGGTVIVPEGKWTTGRIVLKSNINLRLEKGAELYFSGELKDYLPVVFTRSEGIELYSLGAMIYANEAENIALTGSGKLIGPGEDCEIYKKNDAGIVIENFVTDDIPLEERIYDGKEGRELFLPLFFGPVNCRNILVEGVTFENSVLWNVVPQYCENIIIRGITVNSAGHGRTDGIDIDSSRNVLVEYCTLDCGDDCFTIKSGRGLDGIKVNKPSENIVIRHSLSLEGAGGVTCGSETAGMIKNLYVHDCVFEGTYCGLRFKTRRPRGGGGENLHYERIRLNIPGTAIAWDMLGSQRWVGDLALRMPALPVNELTPVFRDITFKDIVVDNCRQLIDLIGIPESPVTGVSFNRVDARCDKLISLQDVDGFTMTNATIQSCQETISITGGRHITLDDTTFNVPGEEVIYTYRDESSAPVIE